MLNIDLSSKCYCAIELRLKSPERGPGELLSGGPPWVGKSLQKRN